MKHNHYDNIFHSIEEAITENIRVQKVIVDQVIQGIDDAIEYNYELRRIAKDYITRVNNPKYLDLRKEQGLIQKPNQKMETALRYMPVCYRAKRWKNKEIHELHESVAKYVLENFLERDMNSNRTRSITPSLETISYAVASIKSNPLFLLRLVNGFREADWERISNFGHVDRSGADCRVMWCSTTDFISCGKWSHHKLKKLIYLAVKTHGACWAKIAQELCDNRRPIFCLQMWQKIINSFIRDVKTTVTHDQKEFGSSSAVRLERISRLVENRSRLRLMSVKKHRVQQKFAHRRRPWSVSEDIDLQTAVAMMVVLRGKVIWTEVSCHVHNRSAVQCRDRWASNPKSPPSLMSLDCWSKKLHIPGRFRNTFENW